MKIDQELLKILSLLVEHKSVSETARLLNISQPAISQTLKKLRILFDDPLLVRANGSMAATERALAIAAEAKQILGQLENLIAAPNSFSSFEYTGTYIISAPEYVDQLLTPLLAKILSRASPHAQLLIRPPSPKDADLKLDSAEVDLRIGYPEAPSSSSRSKLLFSDKIVCMVRKNHPFSKAGLTLSQYIDASHVRIQVSQPSYMNRQIDKLIERSGGRLKINIITPSAFTLSQILSSSNSVATLPFSIAKNISGLTGLHILDTPFKLEKIRVSMYWSERFHSEAKNKWLRSKVIEALSEIN